LSKYFPKAKEKRNNEKMEIKIDGISVNNEKYVIYLLLELKPSLSISFLIDFFTSKKINANKIASKIILVINKYCRFCWVSFKKLLSMKVKNVKNPTNNVIVKIIMINMFFLIKSSIR